jgi:hypothetical protein
MPVFAPTAEAQLVWCAAPRLPHVVMSLSLSGMVEHCNVTPFHKCWNIYVTMFHYSMVHLEVTLEMNP